MIHITPPKQTRNLEPLSEVERALLVVKVLHLPHPQLGGLGLGDSLEHYLQNTDVTFYSQSTILTDLMDSFQISQPDVLVTENAILNFLIVRFDQK